MIRRRAFRRAALVAAPLFICAACSSANGLGAPSPEELQSPRIGSGHSAPLSRGPLLQETGRALLGLVNRERTGRGLPPLSEDPAIAKVARAHSEDMIVRGFLAHANPEGEIVVDRLRRSGYASFVMAAENIAAGTGNQYDNLERIVTDWMRSPVHRTNILHPALTHTGIGVARRPGAAYQVYTQIFVEVRF